jgi:hypothetical protein
MFCNDLRHLKAVLALWHGLVEGLTDIQTTFAVIEPDWLNANWLIKNEKLKQIKKLPQI